ncbi:MAG: Lar family restriction alleviation protein [Eubacteriales bacterium]|nr:Lar family restriction alleviation protein [Eubacteriales bacterium]
MSELHLEPCPFCEESDGVHNQEIYYAETDSTTYGVICEDCGGEIGEFETPEKAAAAWNRRTPDIVRCGDCIHTHDDHGKLICLKRYDEAHAYSGAWNEVKPDGFCSDGQRDVERCEKPEETK